MQNPTFQSSCSQCGAKVDQKGCCAVCKTDFGLNAFLGVPINKRYCLTRQIGGGGTGDVFEGEDLKLNRRIALKFLKTEADTGQNRAAARFEQEARAGAAIDHPGILTISDFGWADDNHPYVVMDYFDGQTLADVLTNEREISEEALLEILDQVCSALAHAHSKRILHRDIKPSNIMVGEHGGIIKTKLIDFGASDIMSVSPADSSDAGGSPLYMSPEQCRGQALDARSDLFSLGCTIYEVATGQAPFIGSSVMETMHQRTISDAPKLGSIPTGQRFSQDFERIVAKLLARSPENRYQSASAVLDDIGRIRNSTGTAMRSFSTIMMSSLIFSCKWIMNRCRPNNSTRR